MNELLRTEFKRKENGKVLFCMYWKDVESKSKWTVSITLTNEQLDDLRVRINSFQQNKL